MAPDIRVRLEVDGTQEAIAEIKTFAKQAKATSSEVASSGRGLGESLGALPEALRGTTELLGALGVAFGAAELAQFTKESINAVAEQKHLAESIGTTVGNYSALAAVADEAGTNHEKLVSGLGELAKRLDKLKSGGGEAANALHRLGLSSKDMSNDTVVSFATIAEALAKVETGFAKSAIAADLMGKNGKALLPLAQQLHEAGGLLGAIQVAKNAGLYIDAAQVATLQELQRVMAMLVLHARGLAVEFAKGFGPAMIASVLQLVHGMDDGVSSAQRLGQAFGFLVRGLTRLILHTQGWGAVLGDVFTGKFDKAAADFKRFDQLLKDLEKDPKVTVTSDAVGAVPDADAEARAQKTRDEAEKDYLERQKQSRQFLSDMADDAQKSYESGQISLEQYIADRKELLARDYKSLETYLEQVQGAWEKVNTVYGRFKFQDANVAITTAAKEHKDAIAKIDEEYDRLKTKQASFAADLRGPFQSALSSFLGSGVNQVHGLIDAFQQLGLAIAQAVQQVAAMRIATALTNAVFGPAPKVTGRARGGLVLGPGGPTSDMIPSLLSNGEFVMPAQIVRSPGMLEALEGIRSGRLTRVPQIPDMTGISSLRRLAEGGLVTTAPPTSSSASIDGHVTVELGEGLIASAIKSPAGQEALLHVVSRNRRAFRRVIG